MITRVLNIFGSLNRGGSETVIMNYYRKIDRSQIQFDFVVHSPDMGSYEKEIEELGGRIYRVRRFNGLNIISYIRDWHKLLAQHPEWEIVHCHFYTIAGYIFAFACNNFRKKIAHSHNADVKLSYMRMLAYKINKFLIKRHTTDFIACSRDAGIYLYDDTVFTVIANAIDAEKFTYNKVLGDQKRMEFNFCDSDFIIGHIGRFVEQKNHSLLIDIFMEIHKRNKSVKLVLVGVGPLESLIKRKVETLGISNSVIFTGERSDVPELMMAMDIFVLPSIFEGLGVVAIEAQASGLHTILSDMVSKAANITQLSTYISLNQTTAEWADTILKYSNRNERINMYQIIKDAGYDVASNVKTLEKLYLS